MADGQDPGVQPDGNLVELPALEPITDKLPNLVETAVVKTIVNWCRGLSTYKCSATAQTGQFLLESDTALVAVRQRPQDQLFGLRGQPSATIEAPSTGLFRSHNGRRWELVNGVATYQGTTAVLVGEISSFFSGDL